MKVSSTASSTHPRDTKSTLAPERRHKVNEVSGA
ncbi:hypothetical protein PC116_g11826 [Phytophthora cactorum]|uniref:Uncharacterized protein n=1 Tax=Phytophthora cactorum TaxID=29920 RepID=A0A8T1D0E2_9STRA|nr:hypothetical protein PC114_g14200 [Phytophthora cactorum]KAG2930017.1 hypothetical protein PC117_g13829 [Phytophthora cactorum]KAG3010052.1 hypothetical protein PC119_g13690 [Phytophthora cactorum]KAG3029949.1 hypothetical protein PC120_g4035 [Phytophthora cactorum]KAG3156570.1 hypothetical protein C6341_g15014 [Phytophthora cactorum]